MRRLATDLPFTCVTCEAEIVGTPTFHVGLPFCCAGCVADGPCICSYDDVPARPAVIAEGHTIRFCLDLADEERVAEPLLAAGGARR